MQPVIRRVYAGRGRDVIGNGAVTVTFLIGRSSDAMRGLWNIQMPNLFFSIFFISLSLQSQEQRGSIFNIAIRGLQR